MRLANLTLLSLAAIPFAKGPQDPWVSAGLHFRIQDSVARLDSVGSFLFVPPLTFTQADLEGDHLAQPDLFVRPVGKPAPERVELVWGGGAIRFSIPPRDIELDPARHVLRFSRLAIRASDLEISNFPANSYQPRPPLSRTWAGGGWDAPIDIGRGPEIVTVPFAVGNGAALVRIDSAILTNSGWDLGRGPHLVQAVGDRVVGRIDTLLGALRLTVSNDRRTLPRNPLDSLEPPESRIVGYGGNSFGSRRRKTADVERDLRVSIERLALHDLSGFLALEGSAEWRAGGRGQRARYTRGRLFADTVPLPSGRLSDAELDATGSPRSGRFLTTTTRDETWGRIEFPAGTRMVQGLPSLASPGTRLAIDWNGLARIPWRGERSVPETLRVDLAPGALWSRQARSGKAVRLPFGPMHLEGRIVVVREEPDLFEAEAHPGERFELRLDSMAVGIDGLTDLAGTPSPGIGSIRFFKFCQDGDQWLQPEAGPVRLWTDTARPWLRWRFRPRLACQDRSLSVVAESLQVAFGDGPFAAPRPNRGTSRVSGRIRSTGFQLDDVSALRLPRPPEAPIGTPWAGLGTLRYDSTIELGERTGSVAAWLRTASSWKTILPDSVRVLVEVRPARDAQGRWTFAAGAQPTTYLQVPATRFGRGAGIRPLDPSDTVYLSLDSNKGSFRWRNLHLDQHSTILLHAAKDDPRTWLVRTLRLPIAEDGYLLGTDIETESIERQREFPLSDGSVVRGTEPFRLARRTIGTNTTTTLIGWRLSVVREDGIWQATQDSVLSVDEAGRVLDPLHPAPAGTPTRPLPPREGRVKFSLPKKTLSVDRRQASRADWQRCVDAGKCAKEALEPCATTLWRGRDAASRHVEAWKLLPEMPVLCATESEAAAYCHHTGGRLPTPAEYAALSRGVVDSTRAAAGRPGMRATWNGEGTWNDGSLPAPAGDGLPLPPGVFDLDSRILDWCDSPVAKDAPAQDFHCSGVPPDKADSIRMGLRVRCVAP